VARAFADVYIRDRLALTSTCILSVQSLRDGASFRSLSMTRPWMWEGSGERIPRQVCIGRLGAAGRRRRLGSRGGW
jgi:hypothetical protein